MIARAGAGALIYLHQTSKGFSVSNEKRLIFHREPQHREPPPPATAAHQRKTQREIGVGAQILSDLNLRSIRLLTNRPKRMAALDRVGISIVAQAPIPTRQPV